MAKITLQAQLLLPTLPPVITSLLTVGHWVYQHARDAPNLHIGFSIQ